MWRRNWKIATRETKTMISHSRNPNLFKVADWMKKKIIKQNRNKNSKKIAQLRITKISH
jgi:hypothetical protein